MHKNPFNIKHSKTFEYISKKNILLLFLVSLSILTYGQNIQPEKKHPIDIKLEKCHSIDSNQTTYGMMRCEAIAEEDWDKEMNKYYKLLMETLGTDEKKKLKEAQISWLNYRDKEKEFSGTMHYNMEGTMWRVAAASRSCEIIKQRALELQGYYDTLTFEK
jgi:uncharacterized protein YecT (DUF1311 family)